MKSAIQPSASPEQPAPNDGRPVRRRHSLFKSFRFAGQGVIYAIRTQRNFRIQLAAGAAALCVAILLRFELMEWAILILTIAAVLILELLNTVIETVVDLVSPEYHPLAKIAKDVAAAAVLIASVAAVAVGVLLVWHHL